MSRLISLLIVPFVATACAQIEGLSVAEPTGAARPDGQLRLGGGYRGADDPCRRTGQTDYTAPMLREDADLVACPIDFEGRPAFQKGTGGREVGRTDAWVLYSVPLLSGPLPQVDG